MKLVQHAEWKSTNTIQVINLLSHINVLTAPISVPILTAPVPLGPITTPTVPLLTTLTLPIREPTVPAKGIGIDYSPTLLSTALDSSKTANLPITWLLYDFNSDAHDLFAQLMALHVTHVFVYLVPKQLALKTVRGILTRLCGKGGMFFFLVVLCFCSLYCVDYGCGWFQGVESV